MLTTQTQDRQEYVQVLEQLYRERALTPYQAGRSIPLRADQLLVVCRGALQLLTPNRVTT